MPRLNKSGSFMPSGFGPRRDSLWNMEQHKRRSTPSLPAQSIREPQAPSIFPGETISYHRRLFLRVWNGIGPLTTWPEVDWWVFRHREGYEPIWDRPPQTTGDWWGRWMSGRDGREFRWIAPSSVPQMLRVESMSRMEAIWAKVKREMLLSPTHPSLRATQPSEAAVAHENTPVKATSDEALREIQNIEQNCVALNRKESISLCATTNKVRHTSKLWALHHRNHLASLPDEMHPEQLRAYKCKWCGSWHVGHQA